jgi:hypothetical protein
MKCSLAALVALASASTALAVTLGTAPAVTIAFKASSTTGGFIDPETGGSIEYKETNGKPDRNGDVVTTKETKTVVNVVRIGNTEILKNLLEAGQLDGVLKGWTIVSARALDQGLGLDGLYAVKKNLPAVLIQETDPDTGGIFPIKAIAATKAGKETTTTANPDVTTKLSYSENGQIIIGFPINDFDVQGLANYSAKYAKGTFGKGANATSYEIEYLAGAIKAPSLIGAFPVIDNNTGEAALDQDGNEINGILEGSISIAAEVVLDLDVQGIGQSQ